MTIIQDVVRRERFLLRRSTGLHEHQTARSARVDRVMQSNEALRRIRITADRAATKRRAT